MNYVENNLEVEAQWSFIKKAKEIFFIKCKNVMKKQVLYVTGPSLFEYGEDFLKVSNYKRAMRTDNCSYLTFPII